MHRFPFTVKMVNEILNIENLDNIKLCIHAERPVIEAWKVFFAKNPTKLEINLILYSNSDYLSRVKTAQNTECKYSCKLDDDVLISRYVWDYLIKNLHKINNNETPILAPILTNGMPSVDMFIDDFLNEQDRKIAHGILLNGYITENMWGLDYSKINQKIKSMKEWNSKEYWNFVSTVDTSWEKNDVPWHYFNVRGVHPSRFSYDYNMFIATKVFENYEKFFNKNEYYLDTFDSTYFTNNMFISETKFWKETLPIFFDGWDEGQLSFRMLMDRSKVLYVRNGFGIHMAYGMTDRQMVIEQEYIKNLWKINL
jgi:hypothetical protein